jgi:hypothetical protein
MSSSSVEKLKTYLSGLSVEGRKDFAKECSDNCRKPSANHLRNKKCGAPLAIRIDKASKGEVPCDSLCPEADFDYLRNQALTV